MKTRNVTDGELAQILSEKFQAGFWTRVKIGGFDECWNWTGGLNEAGYGRVRIGPNSNARSHRIAWIIANQKRVPQELGILHFCKSNRACCNPFHLRPGTDQDNTNDTIEQGHFVLADTRGEKNGVHKLTVDSVLKIRELYPTGQYTLSELGKMFGVSLAVISLVARRKSWKHC